MLDLSREAGTPSAHVEDVGLSSWQADSTSDSDKSMLARTKSPTPAEKNSSTLLTSHYGLGSTKTELYWSDRTVAAKSGSGFG